MFFKAFNSLDFVQAEQSVPARRVFVVLAVGKKKEKASWNSLSVLSKMLRTNLRKWICCDWSLPNRNNKFEVIGKSLRENLQAAASKPHITKFTAKHQRFDGCQKNSICPYKVWLRRGYGVGLFIRSCAWPRKRFTSPITASKSKQSRWCRTFIFTHTPPALVCVSPGSPRCPHILHFALIKQQWGERGQPPTWTTTLQFPSCSCKSFDNLCRDLTKNCPNVCDRRSSKVFMLALDTKIG